MTTPWHRVEAFVAHLSRCAVQKGETVVLLAETDSRPELVEAAALALGSLGIDAPKLVLPTQPNPGPVPIRSTGASMAIAGHPAAVAGLTTADFVLDCTVEGLLHAPELADILAAGTRVLMVSNEHPEVFDRIGHDPTLADRVALGAERLEEATRMHVTSGHGTDLVVNLAGAVVAGSDGTAVQPGTIAHWPGGLVLAFPAAGTVDGIVSMVPGDVNLTFKEYIRSTIRVTAESDFVTAIDGQGVDVDLFRSYLAAWEEPEAYAISHLGWGMNHQCRWDVLPLYDKTDMNGTELRAFAGNFLWSTGANEVAGRFCRGHFDLPMRHCTVTLDGEPVVVDGALVGDLA
ncbi:MAG: peptidase M29 [Deltaproteobacteria bacterium]